MNHSRHPIATLLVTAFAVGSGCLDVVAADPGDTSSGQEREAAGHDQEIPEVAPGPQREQSRRVWLLAPPADFYPYYVADPRRSQSALLLMHPVSTEIPESDASRVGVRLGGRFALVRNHPRSNPDLGWQLDLEAGFSGHFDMGNSLDNIGWDGYYGLFLSWKPSDRLGFRVGALHDSAHVGDEYTERTGRERIGYTREEMVAGVGRSFGKRWIAYFEIGRMYSEMDQFQGPWRVQGGTQYIGKKRLLSDRMPWYAAIDLTSFEENDWQVTVAAQLGLILPTGRETGQWRLAIEYVNGRSVLGEFFFRDESYLALGLYYDL